MNRSDFQSLCRLRVNEANVLLRNGCFAGAYYLFGYAVEFAFKARIAKATRRHDFPPGRAVVDSVYTHDLVKLLKSSGLELSLHDEEQKNRAFADNWLTVKDWTEQSRYEVTIDATKARALQSALLHRKNGVLTWLFRLW